MSSTAAHAYRPTAACIWNSFRSSAKRHLILTGSRGSGKSALLAELFPQPVPGIVTRVEQKKAVYLTETAGGRSVQIGAYDPALPGDTNKMRPLNAGFASLGIAALEGCMACESEWISIDEIGYLECGCEAYMESIRRLMEKKRLAAVVRSQDLPFLAELRRRQDVFLVDLDAPFGNTGCVIMASGMGQRFGGNKLMAQLHGRPLISGVLDATEGIFTRRIVVTRHKDVAELCRGRGVSVLLHDQPLRSDTVRLGLEAIGEVEACVFCPADQPMLRRETLAALALSGVNDPDSIRRVAFEGKVGSPVLFPKWTFPELLRLPPGMGGGALIQKYPGRLRFVSARDRYELMDVDTPEDLAFLAAR